MNIFTNEIYTALKSIYENKVNKSGKTTLIEQLKTVNKKIYTSDCTQGIHGSLKKIDSIDECLNFGLYSINYIFIHLPTD